jgi:aminoglycoside phosphotransferase (APT) family kinase protein
VSGTGLSAAALERVRDAVAPNGRVVRVRPLRGGVSSVVHVVRLETASGKRQAVVVRRYGEYWKQADPAACKREFRLLEALAKTSFPAPRPLLLDAEGGPFGAPTVVMTRLPGRPILAPRDLRDYLRQSAEVLAEVHRVPTDGLGFLPHQRRLVERTLAHDPPALDDPLQRAVWDAVVADWPRVSANMEPDSLLHGDYWPANLLWHRNRLVGVVDWEQPRLGDRAVDVATCRGDVAVLFGPEAARLFLDDYERASGAPLRNLRFWDLLACTAALREILDWAAIYPVLARADLTPEISRERVRAYAQTALDRK